jgi:hypothetical protein
MTQAYRCDETAIENQNDSKFSLEKKRISFTKNFYAYDSRDSPSSVDGATKDQPYGALAPMPVSIMRIERRATHPAWIMFFERENAFRYANQSTAMRASIA